jgi:class 3 adenylate cyclase
MRWILFIIIGIAHFMPPLAAQEAEILDIAEFPVLKALDAQPYFNVLEDPGAQTTIQDVLARQTEFKKFVFEELTMTGYSKAVVWLKLQIRHSGPEERVIYMESSDPQEYLDLYTMDISGQNVESEERVGSFRPLSQQKFRHRFPVLELRVRPGLNTYYIRNAAIAITFPYTFWTRNEILEKSWNDRLILSFIMGSLCVMTLYNLMLAISTKRREYFLYFAYLVSFVLLQMFLTGAGTLTFGDAWAPVNRGWAVWIALVVFFTVQFSSEFLSLKDIMPRLWKVGLALSAYSILIGVVSLWSRQLALKMLPVIVPCIGFLIYAGFRRAWDGYKPALYYVMSWGALMFGATFIVFYYMGLISNGPLANWTTLIGTAVQITFLSLAIGERLRYEIQLYVDEQERLLASHRREVLSREHAFHQLGKVFYPHQLQIMQEGKDLESTMPTGPGKACVIQLDVINSSMIRHVNRKEFFVDFFKQCHELMIQNYDATKMTANAYRIKEVGDGFLCSVGYPFHCPGQKNIAVQAVSLALEFVHTFRACVEKLEYPDPIYCSIGIAAGEIEGFFPNTGTKEYDLYGNGIVLANRYEGMRKSLFQSVEFDLMIVQEEVYKSLPPAMRASFEEVDLASRHLKVRDDPFAHFLYYQIIQRRVFLQSVGD